MNALSFLFPVLIIATFFVFIHAPQIKREKRRRHFLDTLQPGMTVVTTCGIIGRVEAINGAIVTLHIDKNARILIIKKAIQEEFPDAIENLRHLGPRHVMSV